jgi:RimJ/RimL family protein N-acetyltransferase
MIETGRLLLREVAREDRAALVEGLNDFAVSRNTGSIPFPYTDQDARTFIAHCLVGGRAILKAIAPKDRPAALIGVASLHPTESSDEAELGYWIARPLWGLGYGSEAARALVDHGFGETGLHRMVASYHLGNEASRRILEKLGFTGARATQGFSRAQGRTVDLMALTLSKADWKGKAPAGSPAGGSQIPTVNPVRTPD